MLRLACCKCEYNCLLQTYVAAYARWLDDGKPASSTDAKSIRAMDAQLDAGAIIRFRYGGANALCRKQLGVCIHEAVLAAYKHAAQLSQPTHVTCLMALVPATCRWGRTHMLIQNTQAMRQSL